MELFVRRFSACVFDMDGTLCTSRGHPDGHDRVTGATAAALLKYYASGGRVIVATGRPPAAATSVIDRDLPAGVVSLVVCCDGGCILARAATAAGGEWQPVWEAGLSGGCTLRLLRHIEQRIPHRCHFGVQLHEGFDGFGVYGSVASSTRVQELLEAAHPQWGSFIRNMVPSGLRTPAQMAERLPRVLSREALDAKLAGTAAVGWVRVVRDEVDGGDSEQRDLACWLQPLLEAENARGDCGPVELVPEHLACSSTAFIRKAGTDKAVALAVAEELLCISAENICVFGDGSNDLGMFGWAGYGVAPANALPKVKSSANYVSQLSNDEDFIAEFFSRPAPSNTVEGKVAPYSLPDPLRCADGSLVTRADQWPARRAEIMEVFRSQVYGRLPAVEVTTGSAVADVSAIVAEYSVVRREDGVLGGLGSRVEGMMQFTRHFGSTTVVRRVPVLMFLPASAASSGTKAPVFCGLNFSGNHTVHPDPGITRSTVLEDPPILPAHRGAQASLWQVELLLSRGFGILTIYSGDISRYARCRAPFAASLALFRSRALGSTTPRWLMVVVGMPLCGAATPTTIACRGIVQPTKHRPKSCVLAATPSLSNHQQQRTHCRYRLRLQQSTETSDSSSGKQGRRRRKKGTGRNRSPAAPSEYGRGVCVGRSTFCNL
eukprot:COSAG01_NODE_1218_length_11190_cov_3.642954_3_plen_661_part_00